VGVNTAVFNAFFLKLAISRKSTKGTLPVTPVNHIKDFTARSRVETLDWSTIFFGFIQQQRSNTQQRQANRNWTFTETSD
jgi:hypothetical protein